MRPKATAPFDGMIFNMSGSPYAMQEAVRGVMLWVSTCCRAASGLAARQRRPVCVRCAALPCLAADKQAPAS